MPGARWIAVSGLVAACGRPDGGSSVRPTGSATSAPTVSPVDAASDAPVASGPQTFESWWGENPMGLKYAVARTDTADRIDFVLGGSPLSCDVFDGPRPDGTVNLGIRHFLEPDGTWTWFVTRLGREEALLATARVDGATDAAKTVTATVHVDPGRGDAPIAIRGTITATVCHRSDIAVTVKDGLRRSSASMTIAGQRVPIAGARVSDKGIELSTERGGDCFAPSEHRLQLSQWTAPPSAGKWSVSGIWIKDGAFITSTGPTITVGATRTVAGKPVADVTLAGGGRIGPWSVAIEGTIEADVCR